MTNINEHNCRENNRTKSDIEKYGLSVAVIEATGYLPAFAYSIGLWSKFNQPEIICFGLAAQTLHSLINYVADLVKSGQIEANKTYDNILKSNKFEFLKVDSRNINDYFGVAIDFYNSRDFPALQLVWTDRNNKFPWETDFEENLKYRQPLLDRNADFKFREPENLGIFTTKQWLELDRPVLKVVHESDGDWQFLTEEPIIEEDCKLVALKEMVERDKTLNEIFDLDYGEEAERKCVGGKWKRTNTE